MTKIILGLCVSLFCLSANAQYISGTKLQSWIAGYERATSGAKSDDDFDNSNRAMYYVTGIAESYNNMGVACIPNGVSIGQLVSVVGKYLRENPEQWNKDANAITAVALMKAFPCAKK